LPTFPFSGAPKTRDRAPPPLDIIPEKLEN